MNKKTIFTTVFALCVVLAIGAGFYAVKQKEQKEQPTQNESVYTLLDSAYLEVAQQTDVKLYDSGVDGLFYSLAPVRYFCVQEGVLVPMKAAGKMTLNPTVGTAKMHFALQYVKKGGETFGVALWHSDSGVYNQAFAVLRNMPAALGTSKYVLMINTDAKDLSAAERTYSELFSVSKSGTLGKYLFDRRNITPEESGKLRTDWDVLKSGCLNPSAQGVPSLTGRKYHRDLAAQQYDLRLTKSGTTSTVAQGVSDLLLLAQKNSIIYLRQKENKWQALSFKGGKERVIATFDGNFTQGYRLFGTLALREEDFLITDLTTGEQFDVCQEDKAVYAVAARGDKVVCIGKEQNRDGEDFKVQKITLLERGSDKKQVLYANNIMDENSPLILCKEGVLTQLNAKTVFISWENLATVLANMV